MVWYKAYVCILCIRHVAHINRQRKHDKQFRYFAILNRLYAIHECDRQTDGKTYIIIANAALNYIARPETYEVIKTTGFETYTHIDSHLVDDGRSTASIL